jgi:HAMP domain-containing protein
LGILLLAAGCITGSSLWFQSRSLTREAILRGESIAQNLSAPAADAFLSKDTLVLVNLATSATRDNPDLVYAALLDEKDQVAGHPDQAALMKPLDFSPGGELDGIARRATVRVGTSSQKGVWDISVPVQTAAKKVLGSAHVGLARSSVEGAVMKSMLALGAISLVILIIGVGLTFSSLKVLVRPITEISKASEEVGKGDLSTRVPVRSQDETGRLASNFNAMIDGLKQAEAAKIQQGRIEGELELARSIQAGLLPSDPPKVKGLEIAFACQPAKELGGDFYDCIQVNGGSSWGFLIADVSGKGVPAAMHMANLRNLFRIFGAESDSALETLKRVNAMAHTDMKGEAFVTLIYAVLNPKTGDMRMVNAGHDPAYCLRKGRIEAFTRTAPPVGLVPAEDYNPKAEEVQLTLGSGDMLFTYTDGVTEAMNPAGEEFTLNRVKGTLLMGESAQATVRGMLEAVKEHAGEAEQSDDITMLALKAG